MLEDLISSHCYKIKKSQCPVLDGMFGVLGLMKTEECETVQDIPRPNIVSNGLIECIRSQYVLCLLMLCLALLNGN